MTTTQERFQLELRATLVKLDADGRRTNYKGEIELNEIIDLGEMSFTEVAGVLGRVHELGQAVKERQEPAQADEEPPPPDDYTGVHTGRPDCPGCIAYAARPDSVHWGFTGSGKSYAFRAMLASLGPHEFLLWPADVSRETRYVR